MAIELNQARLSYSVQLSRYLLASKAALLFKDDSQGVGEIAS